MTPIDENRISSPTEAPAPSYFSYLLEETKLLRAEINVHIQEITKIENFSLAAIAAIYALMIQSLGNDPNISLSRNSFILFELLAFFVSGYASLRIYYIRRLIHKMDKYFLDVEERFFLLGLTRISVPGVPAELDIDKKEARMPHGWTHYFYDGRGVTEGKKRGLSRILFIVRVIPSYLVTFMILFSVVLRLTFGFGIENIIGH